jgi:hypothetical protein
MAKTIETTQTGLARTLVRFGRDSDRQTCARTGDRLGASARWYDCDVSARGL